MSLGCSLEGLGFEFGLLGFRSPHAEEAAESGGMADMDAGQ